MFFGVDVPHFGAHADARVLADLAAETEAAGWDGFFMWDHLVMWWPVEVADPWIALAAVALRTERLRFGPLITPLARRRPQVVARQAATLDRLSGGRLILFSGQANRRARSNDSFVWQASKRRRSMTEKKHFTAEQARQIGEQLGIDWTRFDVEQYRMGLDVELEHGLHDPSTDVTGNDPILTGKIALAHLNEFPDYYTRLAKMEAEAEQDWAGHEH